MSLPSEESREHLQTMQAHLRQHLRELAGLQDTSGIELFSLMRMLMNLCEAIEAQRDSESGISGPRWMLLMHLYADERHGNREGITPTSLSQFRRVSKNTISALLRGLEQQGLVKRSLDATDRRRFRIQLTPAGRALVKETAPERIAYLNHMASGLSAAERAQLIELLAKLHRSLRAAANLPDMAHFGG